jgi:Holliday junction resolvase RusA-like endonuclease
MGIKKPKLKAGQTVTYGANFYYDEILIFVGIQVPTSQDFYKLIDQEKQLYKLIQKPNVNEFRNEIRERLLNMKKSWWPHTKKLSFVVSLGGPQIYIEFKDLDNYLKTVFDAIKGIVIEDDHQVTSVSVKKEENPFVSGFTVAIRVNPVEGDAVFYYGTDPEKWEEERHLKIERGGLCCMDAY